MSDSFFPTRNHSPHNHAKNVSKKLRQKVTVSRNHSLSLKCKELLEELQNPPSKNLSEEAILKYVTELSISQKEGGLYGTISQMIDDPDHSVRQSAYIVLKNSVSNELALKTLISSGMISVLIKNLPDEIIDNKLIILKTLNLCCPAAEGDLVTLGGVEAANVLLGSPCPSVCAMSAQFVSKLLSSFSGVGRAFDCGIVNGLLNLLCDHHPDVVLHSLEAIVKIAQTLPEKLLYEANGKLPEVFTFLNSDDMDVIHPTLEILALTKSEDYKTNYLARQIMQFIP